MNQMNQFNDVIAYIEANLDGTIDVSDLAKQVGLSLYEFRRVFSFVAGVPIGEYIRKRRMSRAAEELMLENASVTALSQKYGYDAPSSFSRAFKEFHGVTPNEVGKGTHCVNMYTPIRFELRVGGGQDITYTVRTEPAFSVCGVSHLSDMSDTECCEDAWAAFYDHPQAGAVRCACGGALVAVYANGDGNVRCLIGARDYENPALSTVRVPAATWMCVRFRGCDDAKVNAFYQTVLYQCIEANHYIRDDAVPNIEVFPPDMSGDDFEWEIRIAVRKERKHHA